MKMLAVVLRALFFISVVLGHHVSSTKTTEKTIFSLYTKYVPWNTANIVCQAIGGRLIKIDSEVKNGIVQYFKAQDPWKFDTNTWYWIGMFDENIGRYSWSGDCTVQDGWSYWYPGEPDDIDNSHCIAILSTGQWHDSPCSAQNVFICEKVTQGGCTYDDRSRSSFSHSSQHNAVQLSDTTLTLSACKVRCTTEKPDINGHECWAVVHTTTNCILYFSPSPVIMMNPAARLDVGNEESTASVRVCYEATLNSSDIPAHLIDKSDTPTSTCFPYPPCHTCPESSTSPVAHSTSTTEQSSPATTTDAVTTTHQAITTSTSVETTDVDTMTPSKSPTSGVATTALSSPTTVTTTQLATTSTNDDTTAQVATTTGPTGSIEENPETTTDTTDTRRVDVSGKPDPSASIRTTMKTIFTLYEEEATWNQANKMCQQSHGILLMVDSADKDTIVDYFREKEPWKSKLDQAYWIGLFDRDPPNKKFTWAVGCNRTLVDAHWTNWGDREPDRPNLENCVLQEEYHSEWKWATKKCQKTFQFICQSHQGGNCTFEKYTDKAFQLPGNHTLQCNLTECQNVCGSDGKGDECWAYMYNTTSRDCTLFFAPKPVAMMNSSLRVHSNGSIAGVRICYEAATNSSNIKETKHPNPCPAKDPPCRPMPPKMTKAESDAFMKPILDSLDVKHLYNNRKKRKYYSAPDFRPSAKGLGYAAIMLLSIVVGMIVLMDVPRLYQDAIMAIHRLRELLPRNRVGNAPA